MTFYVTPSLEELRNVTISGVTNGQFLQYNAGAERWVNGAGSTAFTSYFSCILATPNASYNTTETVLFTSAYWFDAPVQTPDIVIDPSIGAFITIPAGTWQIDLRIFNTLICTVQEAEIPPSGTNGASLIVDQSGLPSGYGSPIRSFYVPISNNNCKGLLGSYSNQVVLASPINYVLTIENYYINKDIYAEINLLISKVA